MSLFPNAQNSLQFPVPLAEKYRPRALADFVGLEKQKKILGNFAKRPTSGAWLFIGDSGLGKTTMAQALAEELRADVHFIPSQKCTVDMVEETWRLCWNIPHVGLAGWHVVIVDETDHMTDKAQLSLLSKLDSTAKAPQTIWIFTANTSEGLEKRFLSRTWVLEFSNYGMGGDLAAFLAKVWESETGKPGTLNFARIAKDATNNVRTALSALEIELLAA